MNNQKIGALIRARRQELGLTQQELADRLFVSAKAVSKWECGEGCPDVSLLAALAAALGIPVEDLLRGEAAQPDETGGHMKHLNYYVCPVCGNLTVSTGGASLSCCGHTLSPLTPQKPAPGEELHTEEIDGEWFVTADHPMEKEHAISFVAFVTGDRLILCRQYPEWDLGVRLPRGHGLLLWYCTQHGLFRQIL